MPARKTSKVARALQHDSRLNQLVGGLASWCWISFSCILAAVTRAFEDSDWILGSQNHRMTNNRVPVYQLNLSIVAEILLHVLVKCQLFLLRIRQLLLGPSFLLVPSCRTPTVSPIYSTVLNCKLFIHRISTG